MPERIGPYGVTTLKEPPVSKWMPGPGKWGIPEPPRRAYYEEDLEAKYEAMMREQVWGGIQPRPRYRPAFYGMRGGLEGTLAYRDYFESLFPSLVRRFEATLPTYKGYRAAEYAAEEAEKIQKRWRGWLGKQEEEIEEEWWRLSPAQRGERPWAFAPRIQTVGF